MSHRPKPLVLLTLNWLGFRQVTQNIANAQTSKPCDDHLQNERSMTSSDSSWDMVGFSAEGFLFNITRTLLAILGLQAHAEMTSPSFLLNK